MKKLRASWLIILILMLGFFLRSYQYAQFPIGGETGDEFAWTWLGQSLLTTGRPTSWSWIEGYQNIVVVNHSESTYRFVTPYLDNPYLFSLIPGVMAVLSQLPQFALPSLKLIRLPLVLLATANLFLLFLVTRRLFDRKTAQLATLFYAITPTFVFAGRVVVAENLLITWMLVSLLVLFRWFESSEPRLILLLGFVGGLSMLTKISGATIPLATTLILFSQRQHKPALKALLISFLIGSGYFIYGLITEPHLFSLILAKQSNFNLGLATLIQSLMVPQLVQKTFVDGLVFIGYIGLFWWLAQKNQSKATKAVSLFIIGWLGFLLFTTNEIESHGWYKYPLFPLMAIALAKIWQRLSQTAIGLTSFNLLAVLPTIRLAVLISGLSLSHTLTRIIVILALAPLGLLLTSSKNEKAWLRPITNVYLLATIIASVIIVKGITAEFFWQDSLYFFPIRSGE